MDTKVMHPTHMRDLIVSLVSCCTCDHPSVLRHAPCIASEGLPESPSALWRAHMLPMNGEVLLLFASSALSRQLQESASGMCAGFKKA